MAQPLRGYNPSAVEILRAFLIFMAFIAFFGGICAALANVLSASPSAPVAATAPAAATSTFWTALLQLAGGFFVGTLLLALASILRLLSVQIRQAQLAVSSQDSLRLALEHLGVSSPGLPFDHPHDDHLPTFLTPSTPPAKPTPLTSPTANGHRDLAPPTDDATSQQILETLKQLRDMALMSDAQRQILARSQWEKRKLQISKLLDRAIDTCNWTQVSTCVAELKAILPDDPDTAAIIQRAESARVERFRQDFESARVQLRTLLSIPAYDQAEEVLSGLTARYAESPEVAQLAAEVAREKAAYEAETMQRMISELKDATDHKQWKRAVGIAEDFIQRYPEDRRTERLRGDIVTMRENAEAQERRESEAAFKDLLHRQRYEEALELANKIMAKYPNSTAAGEFKKILPKVQELIQQEKLKRQQQATTVKAD